MLFRSETSKSILFFPKHERCGCRQKGTSGRCSKKSILASKPKRKRAYTKPSVSVLSIDDRPTVETEADKAKKDVYKRQPIKGHEFRRACNRIGGQFIKIAPGSPHCINSMEIRHTISPEMELIDELDYSEMDSLLAQKIQQLMIFFSLLIPDMTNEEEQMLDEALIRTYGKFGITHDNDSVYEDRNACLLYTS